jgi:hypothetical protein
MNKNTTIVISLLVFLAIGGLFLYRTNVRQGDLTDPLQTVEIEHPDTSEVTQYQNPEEALDVFLKSFIASAPPATDLDALPTALSLVSDRVRLEMPTEPNSGDLARFVGLQDVPDNGYEIGEVVAFDNAEIGVEDEMAEVEVIFNFSGGDAPRFFQLVRVNNSWKVDAVNPETQFKEVE